MTSLNRPSSAPAEVVRVAQRSDADHIANTLVQAFIDDPVASYVMRNTKSMDAWHKYFLVGVDIAFDRGEVWTTEDLTGACLFFAPNKWHISILTELKAAYRIARASDLATMLSIRTLFHALEASHPSLPHYYLLAVGVAPSQQRKGLGAALLRPMLERCKRDHAAAYLENSNPANSHFYERHGYVFMRSLALPNGTPPVDLMWRAADVDAHEQRASV